MTSTVVGRSQRIVDIDDPFGAHPGASCEPWSAGGSKCLGYLISNLIRYPMMKVNKYGE